jgi:hypothetical protein
LQAVIAGHFKGEKRLRLRLTFLKTSNLFTESRRLLLKESAFLVRMQCVVDEDQFSPFLLTATASLLRTTLESIRRGGATQDAGWLFVPRCRQTFVVRGENDFYAT